MALVRYGGRLLIHLWIRIELVWVSLWRIIKVRIWSWSLLWANTKTSFIAEVIFIQLLLRSMLFWKVNQSKKCRTTWRMESESKIRSLLMFLLAFTFKSNLFLLIFSKIFHSAQGESVDIVWAYLLLWPLKWLIKVVFDSQIVSLFSAFPWKL